MSEISESVGETSPPRKQIKPAPSSERLRECIGYDPETGDAWWKERSGRIGRIKPGDEAGCLSPEGYYRIRLDGVSMLLHRVIWVLVTGEWPPGHIDHKDTNRSNNRWDNLRLATQQQNVWNTQPRSTNKSGFKGVSWNKQNQNWRVRMMVDGRYKELGSFITLEEAAAAYREASIRLHGEFSSFSNK